MAEPKMRYEVTARFDDGLFKIENAEWVKIGPPNPPCGCLACMLAVPRKREARTI